MFLLSIFYWHFSSSIRLIVLGVFLIPKMFLKIQVNFSLMHSCFNHNLEFQVSVFTILKFLDTKSDFFSKKQKYFTGNKTLIVPI